MLLESSFTMVVGDSSQRPITLPTPGFAVVGMCRALLPVHNKVAGGVGDQSSPLAKFHPGEICEFRPITAGHQFVGLGYGPPGRFTDDSNHAHECAAASALTAALNYVKSFRPVPSRRRPTRCVRAAPVCGRVRQRRAGRRRPISGTASAVEFSRCSATRGAGGRSLGVTAQWPAAPVVAALWG
jgi:hypothetical protein